MLSVLWIILMRACVCMAQAFVRTIGMRIPVLQEVACLKPRLGRTAVGPALWLWCPLVYRTRDPWVHWGFRCLSRP